MSLPAKSTKATLRAVVLSQQICPQTGVEPVHLLDAILLGLDLWATFLKGLGLRATSAAPSERRDAFVPISEAVHRVLERSSLEAVRRRHWAVTPGHLALAIALEGELAGLADDPAHIQATLSAALDDLSEVFPPWQPTRGLVTVDPVA